MYYVLRLNKQNLTPVKFIDCKKIEINLTQGMTYNTKELSPDIEKLIKEHRIIAKVIGEAADGTK